MDRAANNECNSGAMTDWTVGEWRDDISWYTISKASDATITIAICVDSLFNAPIMAKMIVDDITVTLTFHFFKQHNEMARYGITVANT